MGAAFIGTEFVGERLPLDGIEYNGCRFDRCTLVYAVRRATEANRLRND